METRYAHTCANFLEDRMADPPPCSKPPSLLLLLLLNGTLGIPALRRSATLRAVAACQLAGLLPMAPPRHHLALLARTLRAAASAEPPRRTPSLETFAKGDYMPELTPTKPVRRRAIRRAQSLSLGLGDFRRPDAPLFAPRIGRHLSASETSLHYKNESLPRFSRESVEHVSGCRVETALPASTYGCRISPVYQGKQERYRALRSREEQRWQDQSAQAVNIEQLALASLARRKEKDCWQFVAATEHPFN
eukprot:Protomagalhaensia_wolfi_Nauph_80__5452@NODE_596_length_2231_cov_13_773266_g447_i0_p2_GENE_NODE_596_length_2231_cov_13_773266_g447_i0NODE_596_length_2231_cov_13_773266_g447_i0_p2_ORF_typecomplete_len249_score22_39_NODE_596_length_2231_cov_13_773266_g447_i014282174